MHFTDAQWARTGDSSLSSISKCHFYVRRTQSLGSDTALTSNSLRAHGLDLKSAGKGGSLEMQDKQHRGGAAPDSTDEGCRLGWCCAIVESRRLPTAYLVGI